MGAIGVALLILVLVGSSTRASARTSRVVRTERASVGLLSTDQLGVALSRQAAAQSPDAMTRAAATDLAAAYQDQVDAITGWLDARGVGPASRIALREPAKVRALPPGMTCALMRPGALGRLASTRPTAFDAAFASLVRSHGAMRNRAVASVDRSASVRRALATSQRRLHAAEAQIQGRRTSTE